MIKIRPSETADTRSCDFAKVTREQLRSSSRQHISDVQMAMEFFRDILLSKATHHDHDKITDLGWFHSDFVMGFKETGWWDHHREISRHHLTSADGVPKNVNLLDVLEMVADCVMAGMGRSGKVFPLEIKPEVLKAALDNTVEMLQREVIVIEEPAGKGG